MCKENINTHINTHIYTHIVICIYIYYTYVYVIHSIRHPVGFRHPVPLSKTSEFALRVCCGVRVVSCVCAYVPVCLCVGVLVCVCVCAFI